MPKIGHIGQNVNGSISFPYSMLGGDVTLHCGDVIDVLRSMKARSVHCIITSPPYYGLRDYGTGTWEGGDANCNHLKPVSFGASSILRGAGAGNGSVRTIAKTDGVEHWKGNCGKCGARRIDQQIGSEPLPDCLGWAKGTRCDKCHICKMVAVFHEIRRVLRDDGAVWLNYGDTYSGSGAGGGGNRKGNEHGQHDAMVAAGRPTTNMDLESGNLVGVPWRIALALQADGWILRQDIVWSKPSPMPESVTNRCTKAHEYVFLLAKGEGYYFDQEAFRQPLKGSVDDYKKMLESKQRQNSAKNGTSLEAGAGSKTDGFNSFISDGKTSVYVPSGANRRSVWVVSSEGFDGAHFATFPPKLIEPMILAGCPERVCVKCGAPQRRVVGKEQLTRERPNDYVKRIPENWGGKLPGRLSEVPGQPPNSAARATSTLTGGEYVPPGGRETKGQQGGMNTCSNSVAGVETRTVGWEQGCRCNVEVTGGTVLDPFIGSGTTACVAIANGRKAVGIDLNAQYLRDIAVPRIEGTAIKRPELAQAILAERSRKALTSGRRKLP